MMKTLSPADSTVTRARIARAALALCGGVALFGCHAGEVEEPVVTVCGEQVIEREFVDALDSNLVIVAAVSEDGSSKSEAIADLALAMAVNGIGVAEHDDDLEGGTFTFESGTQVAYGLR